MRELIVKKEKKRNSALYVDHSHNKRKDNGNWLIDDDMYIGEKPLEMFV